MQIEEERIPEKDLTILRLHGRLSIGLNTEELRDRIKRNPGNIILDLEPLDSVDSVGVSELVGSNSTVFNRGNQMILLNPSAKLDALLHMTRLISIFHISRNIDEAIKSFPSLPQS